MRRPILVVADARGRLCWRRADPWPRLRSQQRLLHRRRQQLALRRPHLHAHHRAPVRGPWRLELHQHPAQRLRRGGVEVERVVEAGLHRHPPHAAVRVRCELGAAEVREEGEGCRLGYIRLQAGCIGLQPLSHVHAHAHVHVHAHAHVVIGEAATCSSGPRCCSDGQPIHQSEASSFSCCTAGQSAALLGELEATGGGGHGEGGGGTPGVAADVQSRCAPFCRSLAASWKPTVATTTTAPSSIALTWKRESVRPWRSVVTWYSVQCILPAPTKCTCAEWQLQPAGAQRPAAMMQWATSCPPNARGDARHQSAELTWLM